MKPRLIVAGLLAAVLIFAVAVYVNLAPGDWLLQTAANSGVGHCLIQLAKAEGLKTINVVRRRSAVDDILALGGTAVICTEDEDLRERVADIAGHDGVSEGLCQRSGGCGRVACAGTAR